MPAPYNYQPLDSWLPASGKTSSDSQHGNTQVDFRLLDLLPGEVDDPIQCKLRHVRLSRDVPYEALSYTWGPPVRHHEVLCDGLVLRVTATLREALIALRGKKTSRTLWIDQLCINQEDIEERSSQVKIMHLIYKRAKNTVVFLDFADTPKSDSPLSRIQLLKDLGKAHVVGESSTIKRFLKLYSHPWFQRAWILQEASKSEKMTVVYEQTTIPWLTVSTAAVILGAYTPGQKFKFFEEPLSIPAHRMFMSHLTAIGPGTSQFYSLQRIRYAGNRFDNMISKLFLVYSEIRFTEVLQDSRHCLSTDPRDRIYALINISNSYKPTKNDNLSWLIEPNYSLPVAEVYTRAARYSIETEHTLEIICFRESGGPMTDLPSWVPDWTHQQLFPITRIGMPFHFRSQFHLQAWPSQLPLARTMNKQPIARFSGDGRVLFVEGYTLDTISTLSEVWQSELERPNERLFYDWMSIFLGPKNHEILSTMPFQRDRGLIGVKCSAYSLFDFWRRVGRSKRLKTETRLSDSEKGGFHDDHAMRKSWRKNTWYRERTVPRYLLMKVTDVMVLVWYKDWLAMTLPYASIGRRVAATRDGFFVLVPPETKEGDSVVFLEGGGYVGYVLRKHTHPQIGAEWHELIGVCYVHGFYGVKKRVADYAEKFEIR
ncbi:heterokaryon incompatibility protein-domain-containing protein [Xylariaceae sp. FL0662B]|nr:heterokaryon incompatibility protein-domain-containing protein [Xylariaceae sp. FL0662B]